MPRPTMPAYAEPLEPRRMLTSIVPLPDGGYLVGYAGWTDAARGVDLFVQRFGADGLPDKAFGGSRDGIAKVDFGAVETFGDIAVLPDGTIAVLGRDSYQGNAAYFAHLTADGAGPSYLGKHTFPAGSASLDVTADGKVYLGGRPLHVRRLAKDRPPEIELPPFPPAPPTDPTFASAGVFEPGLPVGRTMPINYVAGVTALPDGGVLAALEPNLLPSNPGVLKLTAGGQPDVTFGIAGIARLPESESLTSIYPATVVPLPGDGGYLVGGSRYENSIDRRYFLAKLTPAGVLDPTFGTGGVVETDFERLPDDDASPFSDGVYLIADLVLQPDGKFVTAGSRLMRYNANGSVDETFAANRAAGGSIAVAPDGGFVLPRYTQRDGQNAVPHLVAYTADGTLDVSFGKAVPDVLVQSVTLPSTAVVAGTKWGTVLVTLANAGRAKAAGPAELTLALSADGQPGGGTTVLAKAVKVSVGANGTKALKVKMALPADAPAGTFKLVARLTPTAGGALAADAVAGNNAAASDATVLVELPRTDVRNAWDGVLPAAGVPGKAIKLKPLIANDGNVPYAGPAVARAVLVDASTGTPVDLGPKDVQLPALKPGATRVRSVSFALPADLPAGSYRLTLTVNVPGDADASNDIVAGVETILIA